MKYISCWVLGAFLLVNMALAAAPVTLTVNTRSPGRIIPGDFTGLSIFTGTQKAGHRGIAGNLFSASNTQLITLFTNTGIRHLRLGATGSSRSAAPNLDFKDIDNLFAFAKATDIRVIYSLHWTNGPATAQYVWDRYRPYVDCFAYDNEPDNRAEGGSGSAAGRFNSYMTEWNDFARSVLAVAPGALFTGPDAAGRTLAVRFANVETHYGMIAYVTQHFYVGGNPRKHGVTSAGQAIDAMLSSAWDTDKYPALYREVLLPVTQDDFFVRLTESDDYTHGVAGASDALASALWALDYLHWWAEHGARGVDFQNTEWLATDTFYPDSGGNFQVHPKAYGIRAFDLGSRGRAEPVTIQNGGRLNLTGYAVGNASDLCVTVINKEHGPEARAALVTIVAPGFLERSAEAMFLAANDGMADATNGITLGGGSISNNAPWHGNWTPLRLEKDETCLVSVPAASAAIVRLSR